MKKKTILVLINLIVLLLIILLISLSIRTRSINTKLQRIITYYPKSMKDFIDSSNIEITKCAEHINALNKELISKEETIKESYRIRKKDNHKEK